MKHLLNLCLILMALAAASSAQETIVAEFDPSGISNSSNAIVSALERAQTFTCTAQGTLTSVSIYVGGGNNVTGTAMLHILPTIGGVPDALGSVLHSVVLPVSSIPQVAGWVNVDVSSANIQVNVNDVYAIWPTCSGGYFDWIGKSNSPNYLGGTSYYQFPSGGVTNWTSLSVDYGFRVYTDSGASLPLTDSGDYVQHFDGLGYTGFKVTGGVWELGVPNHPTINAAASGTKCWATDLDANYPNNALCYLETPDFDCSQLAADPVLSFQVAHETSLWNDGLRVEINRHDGLGWQTLGDATFYDAFQNNGNQTTGLTGLFWGAGSNGTWREERITLSDVAGRSLVELRFTFGSDGAYDAAGFAIDDVRIESSTIVVDAANPYFQDFERPDDGWVSAYSVNSGSSTATMALWERGTPSLGAAPWSGLRCYATDLDAPYANYVTATLTSPPCDFSALAVDPMLGLALWHDFAIVAGKDGLRVEVDLGDGNGFQTLGSTSDWYDDALSSNGGAGGYGWTDQSNGWRFPQHRIDGAAGKTAVRIRFLCSSNIAGIATGALIDDVRICDPTFAGSESLVHDDLRIQVYIDGEREVGSGDAYAMSPGHAVDILTLSSEGDLVGGEYYLVCEVFPTGATYTNVASDVWISLTGSSLLLDGGVQAPFFVPRQLSPFGNDHEYYYAGGAAGYSCRVQALVFNPVAANGLYASTDAFELKFN
ncbi:MAG: hypothetical protein H6807_11380 [Planctomycetes bacterium]|nr:hypothetical protein [Planctomycetota bacterium]